MILILFDLRWFGPHVPLNSQSVSSPDCGSNKRPIMLSQSHAWKVWQVSKILLHCHPKLAADNEKKKTYWIAYAPNKLPASGKRPLKSAGR